MTVGIQLGNIQGNYFVTKSITPSEVSANTTAEETFTVTGVKVGDAVSVSPPGHQAGVAVCAARVSAADTVAITFMNPTAAGVTPTAGEYDFVIFRSETGAGAAIVAD